MSSATVTGNTNVDANKRRKEESTEMNLSEYVHGQWKTLISPSEPLDKKVNLARNYNNFLSGKKPAERQESSSSASKESFHSPLVSDRYVSIRPPSPEAHKRQRNENSTAITPRSGLSIPPLSWQDHFRKGYSFLLWVRLSTDTPPSSGSISTDVDASVRRTNSDDTYLNPRVLYRFTTSPEDERAYGIEATLYTNRNKDTTSNKIPTLLKLHTMRPMHLKQDLNNQTPFTFITPLTFPSNEWLLLGVQHVFPYLKRPFLSISLNGIEVNRGELAYPAMDVARHNLLLGNIPCVEDVTQEQADPTNLGIIQVDFGGFGLYKDAIPLKLQGILYEHGPSPDAEGVIPLVPPTVQNKSAVVQFGQATKRNSSTTTSAGRGLGIPLTTGVVLSDTSGSSDATLRGELILQKLLSKLVCGISPGTATLIGKSGGRKSFVEMTVETHCRVGNLSDVKMIGISQPRLNDVSLVALGKEVEPVDTVVKCYGTVEVYHATRDFLDAEWNIKIPSYPSLDSLASLERPLPSFSTTASVANTKMYILQKLHLGLPPPGYAHNLQMSYYQNSFHHLWDLMQNDGELAAQLIHILANQLKMGGQRREEILHSGTIHILATLLRKCLLRALRLKLLVRPSSPSTAPSSVSRSLTNSHLAQLLAKETPQDEELDIYSSNGSAPSYIPTPIVKACEDLLQAAMGPYDLQDSGSKRPMLGIHIRRTGDVALSALFGLGLDWDLWGGDVIAASRIIKVIADRYVSVDFDVDGKPNTMARHDSGYGQLLRGQMTVQHLVDMIRVRFGDLEQPVGGSKKGWEKNKHAALSSLANSFSRLLYTLLKYSLSSNKSISRGEQDVSCVVMALSNCPLGSIGAHVILTSLKGLLIYCEILPLHTSDETFPKNNDHNENPTATSTLISEIRDKIEGTTITETFTSQGLENSSVRTKEFNRKLKRLKTDIASRLGRNLIIGQFHDVIAPMLLSRTVFDGRSMMTNDEKLAGSKNILFEWQYHWRLSLLLFIWIASISGADGEKSAKATGSLLLHSGNAGSLSGCMLSGNLYEKNVIQIMLLPPLPTLTSALPPGAHVDASSVQDSGGLYCIDLSNRIRVVVHLLGGLVSSLITNTSNNKANSEPNKKIERNEYPSLQALEILKRILSTVKVIFWHLQRRGMGVLGTTTYDTPRRKHRMGTDTRALSNPYVKAAKESVPSLVLSATLIDKTLKKLRDGMDPQSDTDSENSWVEVLPTWARENIMHTLTKCQDDLLYSAAGLMFNAMCVGGGEASTLVWRSVVSSLDPIAPSELALPEHDHNANSGIENGDSTTYPCDVDNGLLCRLIALVLNKVVSIHNFQRESPWKSIELCSAAARLCDLVEERQLFNVLVTNDSTRNFTLDQARLLCSLIDIMKTGREESGWCQLILPSPPGSLSDVESTQSSQNNPTPRGGPSLLDAYLNEEMDQVTAPSPNEIKYIDHILMARNSQLYQTMADSDLEISPPILYQDENVSSRKILQAKSISSSKLLLPILQPTLRLALSCLTSINSNAMIISAHDIASDSDIEKKSLLITINKELQCTLTAAIVGLAFANARDVCLNALSHLNDSIQYHGRMKDTTAVNIYSDLLVSVVNEMRIRYIDERRKREMAQFQAYEGGSQNSLDPSPLSPFFEKSKRKEAANSSEVEQLLLGNALMKSFTDPSDSHTDQIKDRKNSQDDGEDFIIFPHDADLEEITTNNSMGWNNYRGFGLALEKCTESNSEDQHDRHKVDAYLIILTPFLKMWNERQVIEDEESELVELFEGNHLGGNSDREVSNTVLGYATAADCMSSYIEFASSEASRLAEIRSIFNPTRRYNCLAFVEKATWGDFMELFPESILVGSEFFERCVGDGSRDYSGRILLNPIHPQFSRVIPKQMDNSANLARSLGDSEVDDNIGDLDLGGLNDLVQKGNLKIVDITKKKEDDVELHDDELDESDNVLVSKPSIDLIESEIDMVSCESGDGSYVGFPARDTSDRTNNTDDAEEESSQRLEEENTEHHTSQHLSNITDHEQQHFFSISSFANPPNTSSLSGGLDGDISPSVGHGAVEFYFDNCLHVKTEGARTGTLFLTPSYLIFEYDDTHGLSEGELLAINELKKKIVDDPEDEVSSELYENAIKQLKKDAALRPKVMRWNISELSHIYLRRYRLRDSALEMFFIPSGGSSTGGIGLLSAMSSILLDFGPGREGNVLRDNAANAIMNRSPHWTIKQWPDKSVHFLMDHLRNVTISWVKGRVSNFDYLLALNCLSGRSFNDLCQYPVMPWVLSNYTSEEIPDLKDESNYRDLTKPMGALNSKRLEDFIDRFETFQDAMIPPFMYGSHYSTSAGVVLHFLVRLHPFASLHRQLQGGHFDVADRLFSSVGRTWDMCTGSSAAEVKELTPEWYCNPAFLRNSNDFKLGTTQDGDAINDVILPPWAKGNPEKFVEVLRCALESDISSNMLPDWIDLIFGRKQQGPEAVAAHNVFFYLTYYGSVDVTSIEDEDLRKATELQIAHFGQCPMQLFYRPHIRKLQKLSLRRGLSFSEMIGGFDLELDSDVTQAENGDMVWRQWPFQSAPICHWIHLRAPPPGPHAPLISVRLVAPDRCLAVDAQGIYHFFSWGWKPEVDRNGNTVNKNVQDGEEEQELDLFTDKGFFIAQRELPSFRSIPRLLYSPPNLNRKRNWNSQNDLAVVAVSKSSFAQRSILVVSDGDGIGGIVFQFIDPIKGMIKGHVLVTAVHSSCISAIAMDPIGHSAGIGGAGGELAIIGSDDGTATLWRFIANSSFHLPLRPRFRFGGHFGSRINSVAVSGALNICATVSNARCCVFSLTSGSMISSFCPPSGEMTGVLGVNHSSSYIETHFVETNASCITSTGHIVLGIHVGSKALEAWRGTPNKIRSIHDGRAVMVSGVRGVTVHFISAIRPLEFADEWQMSEDDADGNSISAYDIDFGPSLARPVVFVAGLSSGAIRFHAAKGISTWSEENKKGSVTEVVGVVGNALSKPAMKIKTLVGTVTGTGSRVVGLGKDIGREAISDVKVKGVSGFLGDVFGSKK